MLRIKWVLSLRAVALALGGTLAKVSRIATVSGSGIENIFFDTVLHTRTAVQFHVKQKTTHTLIHEHTRALH